MLMKNITKKARELRKNMTPQERKLWQFLRNKSIDNLKFRRQYPIENYIVDFICNEKNLIIEIDGGQHNEEDNKIYDAKRTKFLESKEENISLVEQPPFGLIIKVLINLIFLLTLIILSLLTLFKSSFKTFKDVSRSYIFKLISLDKDDWILS